MSKGNTFETEILELIFENTDLALLGDATGLRGSTVAGNVYISLHTADPGEAGDQTTSEADYTSYARVAVPRAGAQWTIAAGACENVNAITFPQCTGGTNTVTYFAVGTATSGAGKILYSGALTASLSVSNLITPSFAAGELDITEE